MTIGLATLWTLLISAFTIVGAWYAKRYGRSDALLGLYVTLVIFSGIAASKTIEFDFGFIDFFAPGAVLVFSVTFLLTDIVNERFGRKEVQRMIEIALLAQLALIAFSYLIVHATGAPFFTQQAAFEAVFALVPRIVIASLIAFFVSETLDAYVFDWFRRMTGGAHLWMRNALSSIPAMAIDSIIFVTIAFYGIMPIAPLIIGLTVTKWLVAVIDIPFMYLARHILEGGNAQA